MHAPTLSADHGSTPRLQELDGVRGLLAAWVVVVHLLSAAGIDASALGALAPLFSDGIRVKMFCAMSGFVIFAMLERSRDRYPQYIAKRFLRLYPVYAVLFLVSLLLADVYLAALDGNPFNGAFNLRRIAALQRSNEYAVAHVVAHSTMLHALVPDSVLPASAYAFLGQAWNLTYEWLFYLSAPAVFWFCSVARRWAVGAIFGCVAIYYVARRWTGTLELLEYGACFGVGVLSYFTWLRVCRAAPKPTGLASVALGVAWYAGTRELAIALWIALFGTLLGPIRVAPQTSRLSLVLTSRPLLRLGKISYAMYLCHMVPLYLTMYALNQYPLTRAEYLGVLAAVTFLGTWFISEMVVRHVEQPAIQYGKLRFGGAPAHRPSPVPGA